MKKNLTVSDAGLDADWSVMLRGKGGLRNGAVFQSKHKGRFSEGTMGENFSGFGHQSKMKNTSIEEIYCIGFICYYSMFYLHLFQLYVYYGFLCLSLSFGLLFLVGSL